MTRGEVQEILERMLFITTYPTRDMKSLMAVCREALDGDDVEEYIRVIKTCYHKKRDFEKKGLSPSSELCKLETDAKNKLYSLICEPLGVDEKCAEEYIVQYLKSL